VRLSGKTVFATASGQGIGRASVQAFLAEGATVIATDLNADLLDGLDCETRQLDVTDKAATQKAVADANPDILFNCAGFVHNGTILEATDDEWDFAFNLNCRPMFHTMQAAIPGMLKKGGGSIVNMSSAASSVIGAPSRFIYGASKAAVVGMTKQVATEYVSNAIRCNCICPGTVDSPSLHNRLAATGDYDTALKDFTARQPMGRIATAEEIAALALYLASDESAFTTGQACVIDGGWSL